MSQDHPELADLLLWQSGELEDQYSQIISEHVAHCAVCSLNLTETESLLDDVSVVDAAIASQRMHSAAISHKQKKEQYKKQSRQRVVRSTVAVTTIVTTLFFTLTTLTPSARAESWLSEASRREQNLRKSSVRRIHNVRQGRVCDFSINGSQVRSSSLHPETCKSIEENLNAIGWTQNDLLSAASFQRWRASLDQKTDTVEVENGLRTVTTKTMVSPLLEATIRMDKKNYEVLSARFSFAVPGGMDYWDVSTLPAELFNHVQIAEPPVTVPSTEKSNPQVMAFNLVDPLDDTEARARLALHRIALDQNVLIDVERRDGVVEILGVVSSTEIKMSIAAEAAKIPDLRVSVVSETEDHHSAKLSWKAFHGDAPPLAAEQMQALFYNNPQARSSFVNDLDAASLRLVGSARSHEKIISLSKRMKDSRYYLELHRAALDLEQNILAETSFIAHQVKPLMGVEITVGSKSLKYAQAFDVYTLLHEVVFLSTSSKNLQLEQTLNQLRNLLSTH